MRQCDTEGAAPQSAALSACLDHEEEEEEEQEADDEVSMPLPSRGLVRSLAALKLVSVLFNCRRSCSCYAKSLLQRERPVSKSFTPLSCLSSLGFVSNVQLHRRMEMSSGAMSHRMVWVDLEMTGLDLDKDQIIEMACIITDCELNIIAEGPTIIINQPDELLDRMSDWCKEHHGKSGLIQAVKNSKITLEQAEYEFLSFVRQHTPPGQCPLAGNSVHADKGFLDKYMPQFMYHLHYRIIDVSTIKELCRRWFPEEFGMVPHKTATHRASDDIKESIKELQYYRDSIFKAPTDEKKRKMVENVGNKMN